MKVTLKQINIKINILRNMENVLISSSHFTGYLMTNSVVLITQKFSTLNMGCMWTAVKNIDLGLLCMRVKKDIYNYNKQAVLFCGRELPRFTERQSAYS